LTADSFKKQRDEVLMEKRMKKDESEAVEDEIAEEQVNLHTMLLYFVMWLAKCCGCNKISAA